MRMKEPGCGCGGRSRRFVQVDKIDLLFKLFGELPGNLDALKGGCGNGRKAMSMSARLMGCN